MATKKQINYRVPPKPDGCWSCENCIPFGVRRECKLLDKTEEGGYAIVQDEGMCNLHRKDKSFYYDSSIV